MEATQIVNALSALAHKNRLAIYRMLIEQGPDGLSAGIIAERLSVPPSSLTFHLQQLLRAELITQRRLSRQLFYAADFTAMNRLVAYLTENCCGQVDAGPICDPAAFGTAAARDVAVTIWHNPDCGTSRNTLGLIRNSGEEPRVVEYLRTPPSRDELVAAIQAAGLSVREALRRKSTSYDALGLDDPALSDAALLDAMLMHPILINRPFVFTERGVRLCRPSELVLDILSHPQRGAFTKEDGQPVLDAAGQRAASGATA